MALAVDFSDALPEGMLGLPLFAGALHVDLQSLRGRRRAVMAMATSGVALSTAVVGPGSARLAGAPLLVAVVFASPISPTDPVAALGVLRGADLPCSLEAEIAGEGPFDDGVGCVVHLVPVGLAFPSGDAHGAGLGGAATPFLQEAGGRGAGPPAGPAHLPADAPDRRPRPGGPADPGARLRRPLAGGGAHVSGPIVAVGAGLLIGDIGHRRGMSAETARCVDAFWTLIDEIPNAALFLPIGFELLAIAFDLGARLTGVPSTGPALPGRLAAVSVPILLPCAFRAFSPSVIPIMTSGAASRAASAWPRRRPCPRASGRP